MALPPPKIGRLSLPCPPGWNEYIPKKNRHSESVPRHQGYEPKAGLGSAKALGGDFTKKKFFFDIFSYSYLRTKKKQLFFSKEIFLMGGNLQKAKKRTAPSVPKWSPTSVLTGPDQA